MTISFLLGAGYNDVGMNEQDTIETYTEVIKTATDAGLAYIQMTRYLGELSLQLYLTVALARCCSDLAAC